MAVESAAKTLWPASKQELEQVQAFNKKLAWLPRFKMRNRFTPRLVQALLHISQIGGGRKLRKQGLSAETKVITAGEVSVTVRIIRPQGKAKGVVLDFHGGGWVIGNAQMNDKFNIPMVKECEVTVVSVDYRLALPAPIDALIADCLCAARWLLSNQDSEFADLPVIVVGESAGAHLAAATLLRLKESSALFERVTGALLYYGVYDLTGTASVRNAPPETLVLDGPGMVEALCMLTPELTDQQRVAPPLSPLHGSFTNFPPALMFVGELDPLIDDTLNLADKWRASAAVELQLLPSSPHGFIHFPTQLATNVLAHARRWINAQNEDFYRNNR
ncbi:alpha/beta hydrolase [Pseudomonas sp. NyZ704]|nr:alpha/beta hydrolase [Pseudomonas sp. NyZ704]